MSEATEEKDIRLAKEFLLQSHYHMLTPETQRTIRKSDSIIYFELAEEITQILKDHMCPENADDLLKVLDETSRLIRLSTQATQKEEPAQNDDQTTSKSVQTKKNSEEEGEAEEKKESASSNETTDSDHKEEGKKEDTESKKSIPTI